jgi:hypothetical protein
MVYSIEINKKHKPFVFILTEMCLSLFTNSSIDKKQKCSNISYKLILIIQLFTVFTIIKLIKLLLKGDLAVK